VSIWFTEIINVVEGQVYLERLQAVILGGYLGEPGKTK
jgi:hypothetical protein